MNKQNIEEKVEKIVREHVGILNNKEIDRTKDFLEEYSLDSIGLMQIVYEIENEFSIVFDEEDMEFEQLSTICSLAKIIDSKINN